MQLIGCNFLKLILLFEWLYDILVELLGRVGTAFFYVNWA
jgi:hypothetical protein